jgi:hypothetical protein
MSGALANPPAWAGLLPDGEYIAVPSRRRPLIVASRDPAVLRYLAASVLSVPPGTGPVLGLLLTIGLRAFRHRGCARLAGPLCARLRFTRFVSEAG